MNGISKRLGAFAVAAVALGVVVTPGTANAATSRVNCVADLTGRTATTCFATFTEAMSVATGGRLTDAPASVGSALKDGGFDAKVNASNAGRSALSSEIVISIESDLQNNDRTGGSVVWKGDKECSNRTTDVDYSIDSYNVEVPGFDNRISSFRTYGNCLAKHYENTSQGGAVVGWWGDRNYIGAAMDNRTSSQEWS